MRENYYQILGLNNFASANEIKKAYRKLAKKYHPDKNNGNDDQFKRITFAYNELLDPGKKALLDEWIRTPKSANYSQNTSDRPNYAKRTAHYTSEKKFYTPKVKMQATIFTVVFVTLAVLIPIGLMYKASDFAYQEGLTNYENNHFGKAISDLSRAITWFGQRSGEASILGTRMGMYKTNDNDQALYFITKGLEYSSNKYHIGELYFLKSKVIMSENLSDSAFSMLSMADQFGYNKDSILFLTAQLNAFYKDEFELAASQFKKLLAADSDNNEALFGQAWSLQKLNKPLESIKLYDQLLTRDKNHALGYFYRGHNNIVLGDTLAACLDFQFSYDLGYQPAMVYIVNQCRGY